MRGFLYFKDAAMLINPEDIIAVQLDVDDHDVEYVYVTLRRPNTSFRIPVGHDVFLSSLSNAYLASSNSGGLMDC